MTDIPSSTSTSSAKEEKEAPAPATPAKRPLEVTLTPDTAAEVVAAVTAEDQASPKKRAKKAIPEPLFGKRKVGAHQQPARARATRMRQLVKRMLLEREADGEFPYKGILDVESRDWDSESPLNVRLYNCTLLQPIGDIPAGTKVPMIDWIGDAGVVSIYFDRNATVLEARYFILNAASVGKEIVPIPGKDGRSYMTKEEADAGPAAELADEPSPVRQPPVAAESPAKEEEKEKPAATPKESPAKEEEEEEKKPVPAPAPAAAEAPKDEPAPAPASPLAKKEETAPVPAPAPSDEKDPSA